MTGRFSFTFNLGGKEPAAATSAAATSAAGTSAAGTSPAAPVVVPALKSHDLFPTRIWQAHLDALDPYMERWVQAVLAMRAAHPKPAGRTVRQGWNSEDMGVLEQAEFAPLRAAILAACTEALREIPTSRRCCSSRKLLPENARSGERRAPAARGARRRAHHVSHILR
jgi:hypothetical protein